LTVLTVDIAAESNGNILSTSFGSCTSVDIKEFVTIFVGVTRISFVDTVEAS
jgi:hypothetical protein